MDAIEAMKTRRSVRVFEAKPVPREILEEVVDCARLAATAINVQPWEFIVVTHAETRRKLSQMCDHGLFIAQAPVCIVVFCKETKYYLEDGSAATQNILVAARARGLGSCWVAGDKKPYAEAVRELLGAPPEMKLISLAALGYAAEVPTQPKHQLKHVLHWEKF